MAETFRLDKKDMEILNILRHDAKLTTKHIAKKTLMPATTVHNRIKRMETLGIIKGYAAEFDYKKLGKKLSAYVLITVDYGLIKESGLSQHDIAKNLRKHELVEEVDMITGTHDIIIRVRASDMEQMDEFVTRYLRRVDGIEKTETIMILSEF